MILSTSKNNHRRRTEDDDSGNCVDIALFLAPSSSPPRILTQVHPWRFVEANIATCGYAPALSEILCHTVTPARHSHGVEPRPSIQSRSAFSRHPFAAGSAISDKLDALKNIPDEKYSRLCLPLTVGDFVPYERGRSD